MVNALSSSTEIDRLLAKTKPIPDGEELFRHMADVADVAERIVKTPATERLIQPYPVSLDDVIRIVRRGALLHDTGKAHPDWQAEAQRIIQCRRNGNSADAEFPPHSARSAAYTFESLIHAPLDLSVADTEPYEVAMTLAVLHHHTNLSQERMLMTNDDSVQPDSKHQEMIDALARCASLSSVAVPDMYPPNTTITGNTRVLIDDLRTHYKPGTDEYDLVGALTTLIRSAIRQADMHVSSNGSVSLPQTLDGANIDLFSSLRPYQQKINDVSDTTCLGLAGCGEGKTHSACQWGREMIEQGMADRLVFAMPTQVTGNNLYQTLNEERIEDDVGLYHSGSELALEEINDEQEEVDEHLTERSRRWFQAPVTVCTVDHVLRTLLNAYPDATTAKANLLRSAIIFDEMHVYDLHLVGNILGALQMFNKNNIPWYVMTATLPEQIQQTFPLDNATQIVSEGVDGQYRIRQPFTVETESQQLAAPDVIEYIGTSGMNRIMVVKNTVSEARNLAQTLTDATDVSVTYYSSEFPDIDRSRKETEIQETFGANAGETERTHVLVTTQVCEVSLNLSADVLLTDIAPMDAIIQRAGRLHRKGHDPVSENCSCQQCARKHGSHSYRCIVFSPLNQITHLYPYAEEEGTDDWTILEQTEAVLQDVDTYSFVKSQEWMQRAYDGVIEDIETDEFRHAVRTDWIYGPKRILGPESDDDGVMKPVIRDLSSHRQPVFAETYDRNGKVESINELWAEYHDCGYCGECGVHQESWNSCKDDLNIFSERYSIPVPSWWLYSDTIDIGEVRQLIDGNDMRIDGTSVLGIEYSYDSGVKIK